MPELPEVETVVRDLRELVVGRTIESVSVRLGKLTPEGPRKTGRLLKDCRFENVERRGKFIVANLSDGRRLVVHLKMTGQFLWGEQTHRIPNHVHVIFRLDNNRALYFKDMRQFGRLRAFSREDFETWWQNQGIGPDPFGITSAEFARKLGTRKGRIKPLLLNQQFISGIGNIYADESLFAAGIHPLTPAEKITKNRARKLYSEMIRILDSAIQLRGSTTRDYVGLRGVGGRYQNEHRVYGKTGRDCPICGTPIERLVVGGRGTHVCNKCQPIAG